MKQICFSVPDEDREEIQHYAEAKGYSNASVFARYSTYAQMKKNPLTRAEVDKLERKYGHTDENRVAVAQQKQEGNPKEGNDE